MLMAYIWVALAAVSVLFGTFSGNAAAVSGAVMSGAQSAVELCVSICGAVCLWSGVMEVLRRSGVSRALARALRPVLRRLFPRAWADARCAESLSENVSANLLGLGNAATPAGIAAARRMAERGAQGEMCRLVVMNTASLQLLPTTIAAVRAAAGAQNAFDILPCVWVTSACSVAAGLAAERLLAGREK